MKNVSHILPAFALALMPFAAKADQIKIVADIAPVASIAAMVSGATVEMMVLPGASPHDASLRPSQARQLQEAGLVLWLGEGLSPGLQRPIAQLAEDAHVINLLELPNPEYLESRDVAIFDDHDEHHDDHDDAHSDDHDDDHHDAHEEEGDGHDNHKEEHAGDDHGHDAHDHGFQDPHAWLSPNIAIAWVDVIAQHLSKSDPAKAETYAANAQEAKNRISSLDAIKPTLGDLSIIALHDGFQYLERAMNLRITGAVTAVDGTAASPARLAKLLAHTNETQTDCVLADRSESGANARKLADVLELPLVNLDTLGANLEPGPDLYVEMMRQIGKDLATCKKS